MKKSARERFQKMTYSSQNLWQVPINWVYQMGTIYKMAQIERERRKRKKMNIISDAMRK